MYKEKIIVIDIKKAKYFGIMLDSTPDVAHIDQMSEMIRYVHIENGKIEVRLSFLGFISLTGQKVCNNTEYIVNALKHGLDLPLCRSKGYDNEPTMVGYYSDVQARIYELNSKILFVPCANYSLNLCGIHAFAKNLSIVTFFENLKLFSKLFSITSQVGCSKASHGSLGQKVVRHKMKRTTRCCETNNEKF